MKITIGLLFGGASRDRDRTLHRAAGIFECLDRSIFTPVPLFADIRGVVRQCDWELLYRPGIQTFIDESLRVASRFEARQESFLSGNTEAETVFSPQTGPEVALEDLPGLISLCLVLLPAHDPLLGSFQEAFTRLRLPFTGNRVTPDLDERITAAIPNDTQAAPFTTIARATWEQTSPGAILARLSTNPGFPMQFRLEGQAFETGCPVIDQNALPEDLDEALDRSFFREKLDLDQWRQKGSFDRFDHIRLLTDPIDGLGFPISATFADTVTPCLTPEALLTFLDELAASPGNSGTVVLASELHPPEKVRVEPAFESACAPVWVWPQDNGETAVTTADLSLPTAQIRPLAHQIKTILELTQPFRLFGSYHADTQTYRVQAIDPCPAPERSTGVVPKPTGLTAAYPGVLTGFLLPSLKQHCLSNPDDLSSAALRQYLEEKLHESLHRDYRKVGITFDPLETSGEARRQRIFDLLSASEAFRPEWAPFSQAGTDQLRLGAAGASGSPDSAAPPIPWDQCRNRFAAVYIDSSSHFAIPPELIPLLDTHQVAHNGPSAAVFSAASDTHHCLESLKKNGIDVTDYRAIRKEAYHSDPRSIIAGIERTFSYPLRARPSNGAVTVERINDRRELEACFQLFFRPPGSTARTARKMLRVNPHADVPFADSLLLESGVVAEGVHPVRIGVLAGRSAKGVLQIEVFAPQTSGRAPREFSLSDAAREEVNEKVRLVSRILDISGAAVFSALLQVFPDQSIRLRFTAAELLPSVTDQAVFRHSVPTKGYKPYELLEKIITFGIAKRDWAERSLTEPAPADLPADQAYGKIIQPEYIIPTVSQSETLSTQPQKPDLKTRISRFLKALWSFLSSPFFLKNLGLAVLASGALFFLVKLSLDWYTHHGQSLEVHDYRGMNLQDARKKARSRSFRVVILDSVFVVGRPANLVLDQDPKPFSSVKKNRNIYLTITSGEAPQVLLPSLAGKDAFEQYRRELTRQDIALTIRERQFDRKLEDNTILYLYYEGRRITPKEISEGFKIPKGSKLEAVVSIRNTGTVEVPDLVCRVYSEAVFNITSKKLTLGQVSHSAGSPEGMYVWKQEPAYAPGKMINLGDAVNIYLTPTKPEGCQ